MKNYKITLASFMLIFTVSASVNSQNIQTTIPPDAILKAWENMANMVIGTAEAMPSEHFEFTPHEDLRDFASQINHTSSANYLFATVVKLQGPNEIPVSDSKAKEQVIKELTESFQFISNGIKKLDAEDLNEEIQFFGRKMPRLQAILMMTSHLQREHGKTITYVRIKGIAPSQSMGW